MLRFSRKSGWMNIIIAAMACLSAMAIANNLNQSAKRWRDMEWMRNERVKKKAPAAVSLILQEGTKAHASGDE